MRRILLFLIALSFVMPAAVAFAEEDEKPGMLARVFHVKPKVGMLKEFKEAYKTHIEWHQKQDDDWHWTTYSVQAGEDIGEFIIITGGHNSRDLYIVARPQAQVITGDDGTRFPSVCMPGH